MARCDDALLNDQPERNRKKANEEEAKRHHEAERPEQWHHIRHCIPGRLRDHVVSGIGDVGSVLTQEESISKASLILVECRSCFGVGCILTQGLKSNVGGYALPNFECISGDQIVDPGNDSGSGPSGDET